MSIRHLIFDLDGTLIDSSEGVVEAVNYSLRRLGQPEQQPAAIKRYIGFPLENMYPAFTDAPVAELRRHFQVKAAETVVASTVILDGVEPTLRRLQKLGYSMAIATTKIKLHVDRILTKFGWESLFEATVGGDEVTSVKPHPDAFLLALKRMNAKPQETLVVGDTINDILAARAVPMKAVAVLYPYADSRDMLELAPDYYIESIAELDSILNCSRHKADEV